jgi:hypothetical protein
MSNRKKKINREVHYAREMIAFHPSVPMPNKAEIAEMKENGETPHVVPTRRGQLVYAGGSDRDRQKLAARKEGQPDTLTATKAPEASFLPGLSAGFRLPGACHCRSMVIRQCHAPGRSSFAGAVVGPARCHPL